MGTVESTILPFSSEVVSSNSNNHQTSNNNRTTKDTNMNMNIPLSSPASSTSSVPVSIPTSTSTSASAPRSINNNASPRSISSDKIIKKLGSGNKSNSFSSSSSKSKQRLLLKGVVCGDENAGKSCLLRRLRGEEDEQETEKLVSSRAITEKTNKIPKKKLMALIPWSPPKHSGNPTSTKYYESSSSSTITQLHIVEQHDSGNDQHSHESNQRINRSNNYKNIDFYIIMIDRTKMESLSYAKKIISSLILQHQSTTAAVVYPPSLCICILLNHYDIYYYNSQSESKLQKQEQTASTEETRQPDNNMLSMSKVKSAINAYISTLLKPQHDDNDNSDTHNIASTPSIKPYIQYYDSCMKNGYGIQSLNTFMNIPFLIKQEQMLKKELYTLQNVLQLQINFYDSNSKSNNIEEDVEVEVEVDNEDVEKIKVLANHGNRTVHKTTITPIDDKDTIIDTDEKINLDKNQNQKSKNNNEDFIIISFEELEQLRKQKQEDKQQQQIQQQKQQQHQATRTTQTKEMQRRDDKNIVKTSLSTSTMSSSATTAATITMRNSSNDNSGGKEENHRHMRTNNTSSSSLERNIGKAKVTIQEHRQQHHLSSTSNNDDEEKYSHSHEQQPQRQSKRHQQKRNIFLHKANNNTGQSKSSSIGTGRGRGGKNRSVQDKIKISSDKNKNTARRQRWDYQKDMTQQIIKKYKDPKQALEAFLASDDDDDDDHNDRDYNKESYGKDLNIASKVQKKKLKHKKNVKSVSFRNAHVLDSDSDDNSVGSNDSGIASSRSSVISGISHGGGSKVNIQDSTVHSQRINVQKEGEEEEENDEKYRATIVEENSIEDKNQRSEEEINDQFTEDEKVASTENNINLNKNQIPTDNAVESSDESKEAHTDAYSDNLSPKDHEDDNSFDSINTKSYGSHENESTGEDIDIPLNQKTKLKSSIKCKTTESQKDDFTICSNDISTGENHDAESHIDNQMSHRSLDEDGAVHRASKNNELPNKIENVDKESSPVQRSHERQDDESSANNSLNVHAKYFQREDCQEVNSSIDSYQIDNKISHVIKVESVDETSSHDDNFHMDRSSKMKTAQATKNNDDVDKCNADLEQPKNDNSKSIGSLNIVNDDVEDHVEADIQKSKSLVYDDVDNDSDDDHSYIINKVTAQKSNESDSDDDLIISPKLRAGKINRFRKISNKEVDNNTAAEAPPSKTVDTPVFSSMSADVLSALAAAKKEAEKRLKSLNDSGQSSKPKKKSKKKEGKKEKKQDLKQKKKKQKKNINSM